MYYLCYILNVVNLSKHFQCVNYISLFVIILLMLRSSSNMIGKHFKCRSGNYPRSTVTRFPVPDDKVNWAVEYKNYEPPYYTAQTVFGKPWADPEIGDPTFKPKWNSLDGKISRESHMMGAYQIVNNYPLNPIGRTGIHGRGVLGRWGPNHAADPVVTKWKKHPDSKVQHDSNNKPILQFVAIKRGDTGEWALPGGMVDPGEKVTNTAIREFQEEAMNSLVVSQDDKVQWQLKFKDFFSKGIAIYQGYVDDPRNTDNSWMETVAYNFHDEDGSLVGKFNLQAGDDAVGVCWVDITPDLKLYANHKDIVKKVLEYHMVAS